MIFAKINGQSIRIRYDEVVSDSVEYLKVKFEYSDDWTGYTKTAVFTNEALDKSVAVVMEEGSPLYIAENTCLVPYEVIKAPEFRVSVFGIKGESLITASAGYVEVVASGYCEGDEPSAPTESEYQQIINIMSDTQSIAQSVREDADSDAFKGEKGDKGDTGDSGVYVGSGEMPEDCNVQIDPDGNTIDMNSLATKQYVDEEIATFDFIKVVDSLPESGLVNRIYLVPNIDAAQNNLFDEYIWVNGAWEFITTKIVEVDLVNYPTNDELSAQLNPINSALEEMGVDYIVERGTSGIWTYEKWASGKAVCWGVSHPTYENQNILLKSHTLPFILVESGIGFATINNDIYHENFISENAKIKCTTSKCSVAMCSHKTAYSEETVGEVAVYIVGRWK